MTDHEPRPQTDEWVRLVEAHNAVARLSQWIDDGQRGPDAWVAFRYIETMLFAAPSGLAFGYPHSLYRNGICVAQWRIL